MTKALTVLCTALLVLGSSTTAAARTRVLEPTSSWTVDYGDEKCSLLRDFGSLKDGLGLRIDSYGSLSTFQLSAIGDRVPRPQLKLPVTRVGFALSSDGELRRDVQALTGTIGDHRFVQFGLSFLPPESMPPPPVSARDLDQQVLAQGALVQVPDTQFEARVNSLVLELRRGEQLELKTGPMAPALNALRTCVDDLRKSWGLDPAQQRAITRQPYPPLEAVKAVQEDFPRELGFRGINGFVPLRVMVDPTGVVTNCVVQLPDAPEPFRTAACANLGSKFEPALGDGGQPVDSFYQTSVIYLVSAF